MSGRDAVVETTRGGRVESRHRVSAAAIDAQGQLVAWLGDPELLTFYRSAAKPLQALPVVADGVADAYGFSERELAVCCASHSGEAGHVETVASILSKIGCSEDDLECGTHWPFHAPTADALRGAGKSPSRLQNNCSGKHAGMLAWSRHNRMETAGYVRANHAVQMRICREIGDWSGSTCEAIPVGVDGCGVPAFAQPLNVMAGVYARLMAVAKSDPASPAGRVTRAMTTEPWFVAGTNRLTTRLMQATGGRLLAKYGAEAVYCLAERESGLGIAVKVEDGQKRAVGVAVIELLAQLDLITTSELAMLADRHVASVTNARDEIVGEIRPAFRIERAG